jgi:rhodanese-related sulfurtransferase
MPDVLGTAIVRVFDAVAAVTGCNSRCIQQRGATARAVWTPAKHHVGYYPGAEEMILKLLYEEGTGKLLGAQAVGGAGVDKRIDVLATTIRFGGTVEDLTELDLAYAPPFGAAKDPVHLAGFVAQNELRQLDHFVTPAEVEQAEDQVQLLDVRTAAERTAGHIDRAVHIPLHELRGRLDELDRDRRVITICRGGQRAYYASRILRQHGFADVRTMTGGMHMHQFARPETATAAS